MLKIKILDVFVTGVDLDYHFFKGKFIIFIVFFMQDCYAESNSLPKIDEEQDWELLEGQENETHTTLIFKRKLETCDFRDYPINDDTFRLIYSYNDADPESFYDIQYHGPFNRGSRSIMLLKSQTGQDISKENVQFWDIKSPNFTITREYDSIYWCSVHKAPPLDAKQHVIKIEALLQKGNERYIHHIVLYQCIGKKSDEGRKYLNHPGYHCYHQNMPPFFHQCQSLYAAWGIGGEPMIMPEEAGLPLGGSEDPYFLLQMHYDNPALHDGIVDSSGMRLYFVPTLRKYDAMTLMVGAKISRSVIIPPRQKYFTIASHGHPECLGSVMPKEGIQVIAVFLHAHLLGRKLIARHFRNDTELPPLAADNNYDFNYQGYRFLNRKVTVLPGDQITVECRYDSTGRSVTTFGGLSTKEEMCIAFILYYPRIAISGSLTGPSLQMIMSLTGIRQFYQGTLTISLPVSLQNHSYLEHLMLYPWTPKYVKIVENVLRYSPHTTSCMYNDDRYEEMSYLISYPEIRYTYEKEKKCFLETKQFSKHPKILRETLIQDGIASQSVVTSDILLTFATATTSLRLFKYLI